MLDSGASINIIDTQFAKRFNLSTFGTANATVVGGFQDTSFAEVKSLQIGPMTIVNTTVGVMDLESLAPEKDEPKLVGILGYDFFRRTILEIVTDTKLFGEGTRRAFLYDPYKPTNFEGLKFTPLKINNGIAYVDATVKGNFNVNCPASRNVMLLDLGATSELMFNYDKALAAKITNGKNLKKSDAAVGVGGSELAIQLAPIRYVDIGGFKIERETLGIWILNAIKAELVSENIDVSDMSNGILCMGLFDDCRIVLNYPKKQFGIG